MAGPDFLDTYDQAEVQPLYDGGDLSALGAPACMKINPISPTGEFSAKYGPLLETHQGEMCAPALLPPDMTCKNLPSSIPVGSSRATFEGELERYQNGYNLKSGTIWVERDHGVCDKFPSTAVTIVGVELEPIGPGDSKMLARTETGITGNQLVRVYIDQGDGVIRSYDGQSFLNLYQYDQILFDPKTLQPIESVNTPPSGVNFYPTNKGDPSQASISNQPATTQHSEAQNAGCNASTRPMDISPALALAATGYLVMGAIRKRLRGAFRG